MSISKYHRRVYALTVLGILLVSTLAITYNIRHVGGAGEWWNPDWKYRKTITINHLKVNATLTDFPVLISLTDPDLASKAQNDGRDIVFTDSSLVKLDHEIESYDHSMGKLIAWVQANVSSTLDTVLQMYYGNPSASNQQNPTGVWDSNYVMVQHLSEAGNPTSSPSPWHQYEGNPILNGSTDGFGSAIYDGDSGIYHYYCSWGSILHYTSLNGKTGWTADPLNPMLTGNSEGVPAVWKENGVWYMLYRYGGPDKIGLANSTDASHWTRYEGNPVINVGSFCDPWGVIKVGSTYYLWVNDGYGGSGRGAELHTSTDLIHWTADTNAIFSGGRYCVFPFKYGAYYYMLVPHYTTGSYGEIELYRCSNPTFYAAQREFLGIIVPTGPAGSWWQYRHDTPCVLTDTIYRDTFAASNNELWMYYSSTPDSGGKWWTGMCIEQNMTDALTRFTPQTPSLILDSTSNHNNGVPNGGLTMNVSGIIDGGDSFDGSNDYIDCGNNSTLKGMGTLTVEIWIKPNAIGGSGAAVLSKWASWTSGSYIMFWGGSGNIGWGVINQAGSSGQISGGPALAIGQWQHLVGVYNGTHVSLYRNASIAGTPGAFTGTLMSENTPCYVGRYTTPYFNGIADEVRISNVSRSASWITTEYNNQGSPSTFYSVGTEENAPSNFTLTVTIVGQGSVNLNAAGPYNYGDTVQLTALPDAGWSFKYWSGALSGSANPATIVMDSNKSVTAYFNYPKLYVSPALTEKALGDVGSTFDVQVKIEDVKDMWGFDFRLEWDSSLLTLSGVEYNSSLDATWGYGNWFAAMDINGSGFYQLAAVSLTAGFNSTGPQALATLTFRVEDPHSNFPLETLMHFVTHKLSNSQWKPIGHTFENGTYRMREATKPALNLIPTTKTCRKYGETFTVAVNLSNGFNVTDFEFEIDFNTTLLDYSGVTWNAWSTGNLVVDEVNGKITGDTAGSALNGAHTLMTVEFTTTLYRIWKSIPGWVNDQNGKIFIQAANLSYPGALKLSYVKDGLNEINVGSDVTYTFSPIQGDIDNDGNVGIFDLRTVAAYYDQQNSTYNLTGDPTIDIFDLVIIASNFGYTYIP
jgi:hypothetical protein